MPNQQPSPHATGAQPDIPARAARCSQRGCVYLAVSDGLCRQHLRDRESEYSPVGCAAASLICVAPVHVEKRHPIVDKKPYRCRTLAKKDRRSFGSKNGSAKLDEATVAQLRAEAEAGTQSRIALAEKYSIHRKTLWRIVHGRNWKHVTASSADPMLG
jgi:hypothetical protein